MIRSIRHVTLGHLRCCGLLLVTLLVAPALAATSALDSGDRAPTDPLIQAADAPGLAEFLDEQGQLALPAGFSGSLNPAGFELVSGTGEAPRFAPVAKGGTNPDDARWTGFGGIANGCNGQVRAIAVGSDGDIYLGGDFTLCGDTPANSIVRYASATNTWHALGSGDGNGVDGIVYALAVSGSDLFVGGAFSQANVGAAIPASRIARWNGIVWQALGSSGGNGVDGTVNALAASGGDLFVGGMFTQANVGANIPANRIARWNGSTWQALGSGGGNGVNGFVLALAVSGGDLFVGGVFNQVNVGAAIPARQVARWNGSAWQALGSGGGNGVNDQVNALAVSGGDLFVGGFFSEANVGAGIPANKIVRWNGSAWQSLGSGGGNGVDGNVFALAVSGADLFVGGSFSSANVGATIPANRVARWNGSAWQALSNGGDIVVSGVSALAISGGDLFASGGFTSAVGVAANQIARWNGSAWQALGSGSGNGVSAYVVALAVSGDDVFVGGAFVSAGGIAANCIARWNGSTWQALGSGGGNGVNSQVNALAVSGGDLFVGGLFNQANVGAAIPANRIARWNGSAWQALGSGGGNGVNSSVSALVVSGGELYVGGSFTQANVGASIPANGIARWSNGTWQALGSSGGNGVNGAVFALAASGGDLFVGGSFIEANVGAGIPANRIARWNGSAWQALGSGGGNGVDSNVNDLAVSGADLFVGGSFTQGGFNHEVHRLTGQS